MKCKKSQKFIKMQLTAKGYLKAFVRIQYERQSVQEFCENVKRMQMAIRTHLEEHTYICNSFKMKSILKCRVFSEHSCPCSVKLEDIKKAWILKCLCTEQRIFALQYENKPRF